MQPSLQIPQYVFRVNANSEEKLVHPNHMVYQKMESLVNHMLDAETGVPIKTVKSFLSKVPSVFTGQDLIAWIMKSLDMSDLCKWMRLLIIFQVFRNHFSFVCFSNALFSS